MEGRSVIDHDKHVTRVFDQRAAAERPAARGRLVLLALAYAAGIGGIIAIGFVWFLASALGVFRG